MDGSPLTTGFFVIKPLGPWPCHACKGVGTRWKARPHNPRSAGQPLVCPRAVALTHAIAEWWRACPGEVSGALFLSLATPSGWLARSDTSSTEQKGVNVFKAQQAKRMVFFSQIFDGHVLREAASPPHFLWPDCARETDRPDQIWLVWLNDSFFWRQTLALLYGSISNAMSPPHVVVSLISGIAGPLRGPSVCFTPMCMWLQRIPCDGSQVAPLGLDIVREPDNFWQLPAGQFDVGQRDASWQVLHRGKWILPRTELGSLPGQHSENWVVGSFRGGASIWWEHFRQKKLLGGRCTEHEPEKDECGKELGTIFLNKNRLNDLFFSVFLFSVSK